MADRYDERVRERWPRERGMASEGRDPRESGWYGREPAGERRRGTEDWNRERRYSGNWDRDRRTGSDWESERDRDDDRDFGEWAREKWNAAQDWMRDKWGDVKGEDRERDWDRQRWERERWRGGERPGQERSYAGRERYGEQPRDWDRDSRYNRDRGPAARWGAHPGSSREGDWRGVRSGREGDWGWRGPDRDSRREDWSREYRGRGEEDPEWRRDQWSTGHAGWINRGDWGGDVNEEARRTSEWQDRRRSNFGREDFGGYGREGERGSHESRYGGESGAGGASTFGYGGGMTGSTSAHYGGGIATGRFAGRGPKGYQRSDERMLEEINDRLTDDPNVDASEIDVKVSGGEVTLSGTTDSRHAKRRAEEIAEEVRGVREVHNQIRVKQSDNASVDIR